MEISEYQNMYECEGKHFYYVSLHNLIVKLIRKYAPKKNGLKILDAGCGTGMLMKKINSFGKIVGMDFNQKAVDLTRKRGCVVKKGSVTKIPFESKSFDVVTCIDVLVCKEIDDDTRALREICRVLKPKGITIVRVSANKWLDLAHDKHVHSIRRYEKSELIEMFKQSNFEILRISHMNVFLLPIVSLKSAIEKVFPPKNIESSIGDVNPLINWCARLISEIENFLLLRADIPLGLGLLVVARKVNDK